jgi:hypothetical protein
MTHILQEEQRKKEAEKKRKARYQLAPYYLSLSLSPIVHPTDSDQNRPPKSLLAIQTEEKAIRELSQLYKGQLVTVRVVQRT